LKVENFNYRFGKPPQTCSNCPSNQAIIRNGPPNFGKAGRARRQAGGYDAGMNLQRLKPCHPILFSILK
jgi:hypothetical protein